MDLLGRVFVTLFASSLLFADNSYKALIDPSINVSISSHLKTEELKVDSISYHQAMKYFEKFADRKDIPFKYPIDGCYARAHEMAQELERKGIKTAKIFAEGMLIVKSKYVEGNIVNWGWHVAPVIYVNNFFRSGKQLMVIDPSLFDRPVPVEDWLALMNKEKGSYTTAVYFTPRYQYYPARDRSPDAWVPENLHSQRETMERYLKYQEDNLRKLNIKEYKIMNNDILMKRSGGRH